MDFIVKGDMLMCYSLEFLYVFVEVVVLGLFFVVVCCLKKIQFIISIVIVMLEVDFGLILFDCSGCYFVLINDGCKVFGYVQDVLVVVDCLEQFSICFVDVVELCLSLVFFDIYQIDFVYYLLWCFEQCFLDIELEWLDVEGEDVLDVVQCGCVYLGLLLQQVVYFVGLVVWVVLLCVEMVVFVVYGYVLVQCFVIDEVDLVGYWQICLSGNELCNGQLCGWIWVVLDYLMVLEMVEDGFGWVELLCVLVVCYGCGQFCEFVLFGWLWLVVCDVVWFREVLLGLVVLWLLDQFWVMCEV